DTWEAAESVEKTAGDLVDKFYLHKRSRPNPPELSFKPQRPGLCSSSKAAASVPPPTSGSTSRTSKQSTSQRQAAASVPAQVPPSQTSQTSIPHPMQSSSNVYPSLITPIIDPEPDLDRKCDAFQALQKILSLENLDQECQAVQAVLSKKSRQSSLEASFRMCSQMLSDSVAICCHTKIVGRLGAMEVLQTSTQASEVVDVLRRTWNLVVCRVLRFTYLWYSVWGPDFVEAAFAAYGAGALNIRAILIHPLPLLSLPGQTRLNYDKLAENILSEKNAGLERLEFYFWQEHDAGEVQDSSISLAQLVQRTVAGLADLDSRPGKAGRKMPLATLCPWQDGFQVQKLACIIWETLQWKQGQPAGRIELQQILEAKHPTLNQNLVGTSDYYNPIRSSNSFHTLLKLSLGDHDLRSSDYGLSNILVRIGTGQGKRMRQGV
ncbi:hypothetical protein K435DRAFT_855412, partial [Dendrothele bispora CBS 962.96]